MCAKAMPQVDLRNCDASRITAFFRKVVLKRWDCPFSVYTSDPWVVVNDHNGVATRGGGVTWGPENEMFHQSICD